MPRTFNALVKMPIRHFGMLVELGEWFCFLTFKTSLYHSSKRQVFTRLRIHKRILLNRKVPQ